MPTMATLDFVPPFGIATIVPIQGTTPKAHSFESMPRGRPTSQALFETPLSETQRVRVMRNGTDYYVTTLTDGRRDSPPHSHVRAGCRCCCSLTHALIAGARVTFFV